MAHEACSEIRYLWQSSFFTLFLVVCLPHPYSEHGSTKLLNTGSILDPDPQHCKKSLFFMCTVKRTWRAWYPPPRSPRISSSRTPPTMQGTSPFLTGWLDAVFRIWIQGSSGSGSRDVKRLKMLNNHKVILFFKTLGLFVDFFWWENLIIIK